MKFRHAAIPMAVAAALAGPSHAQQATTPPEKAEADSTKLERIEVTSSRRVTATQDLPYAVQSIDGAAIREKNYQQLQDYLGEIPGIGFGNRGEGRNDIFLRGISSPGVGRSAVGIYLDEIPLAFSSFQPDANVYDMARIEVLKGPQGTLYGEGALGGAIKYITNKPKSDRFEANVQATAAWPKDGRMGSIVNAMLNLPLAPGVAAVRVVGAHLEEGGWIDNPTRGREDANRGDTTSLRALASFTPVKNLELLATYLRTRSDVEAPTFADYGSSDLMVQRRPVAEPSNTKSDTYNLTANWALASGTITFSASKSRRELNEVSWAAANSRDIGAALGIPNYVLELTTHSRFDIGAQELRYVSADTGAFRYVVGAFAKERKQPFVAVVPNPPITAGALPDPLYDNTVLDRDRETAIFGEGTYDLTPALHATAGLRFSREKNDVRSDLFIFYAGQLPTQVGASDDNSVSPRVALSYDLVPTQTVYATVGKGYRSGGANFQIDPTQGDPLSYSPDTAVNYEVGHKGTWANGRVATEIALYYLKWKDIQVFTNSADGARSYTFNGGRAASMGLELLLRARPARGLDLAAGASLMRAEYKSDIPEVRVTSGTDLPFSPHFTGFANATYTWPVGGGMDGVVLADVQHTAKRLDSVRGPLEAYTTFDLRAGIRRKGWEVMLFGRNLGNSMASLDVVRSLDATIPNRPRTVGVTVSAAF